MMLLLLACSSGTQTQHPQCELSVDSPTIRRMTAVEMQNSILQLTGVLLPENLLPPTTRSNTPRTWAINNTLGHSDLENLLESGKYISNNIEWDSSPMESNHPLRCTSSLIHLLTHWAAYCTLQKVKDCIQKAT